MRRQVRAGDLARRLFRRGFISPPAFSGHGFGIGPGAGRLAADLVSGAPPVVDPYPFRYSRMIDGTRLVPYAGL